MNQTWIVALITTVLSGGLVYALVAWRKGGAERESIIVTAAQGLVLVQTGVIDSLEERLERQRQQLDTLHGAYSKLDERLAACEDVRERVEHELRVLEQKAEFDQLGREGKIDRRTDDG
jgi:uncharacterized protein YhaN